MTTREAWQPARIIPVSGLSAADEQERRGASALLAVMHAVNEYGRSILQFFGAPAGRIETFIEVPFELGGVKYRPDGLIQVTRGIRTWTALVEVKTLRNKLDEKQVKAYLDIARQEGFDAVITISNEMSTVGGAHPLSVEKRMTRKVSLHHISWSHLHAEALISQRNRSVKDPVQAWLLTEFIRYLEYPKSGAIDFDDMGPSWVTVRKAALDSTLRAQDPATHEVVDHYSQLMRFVAMSLSSQLGVHVHRVLAKKDREDPTSYVSRMANEFATSGRMFGSVAVPDAVAPIEVTADLRAGRIFCSATIAAPNAGRATTRVNWLLRQLKDAPSDLMICANGVRTKDAGPTFRLDKINEQPECLLPHPKFEVRSFSLTLSAPAGGKRGQGTASFVDSVLGLVNRFYEGVIQEMRAWNPPAPKITASPPASETDHQPFVEPLVSIANEIETRGEERDSTASSSEEIDTNQSFPVVEA